MVNIIIILEIMLNLQCIPSNSLLLSQMKRRNQKGLHTFFVNYYTYQLFRLYHTFNFDKRDSEQEFTWWEVKSFNKTWNKPQPKDFSVYLLELAVASKNFAFTSIGTGKCCPHTPTDIQICPGNIEITAIITRKALKDCTCSRFNSVQNVSQNVNEIC